MSSRRGWGEDGIFFEHDAPCSDPDRHRHCEGRWRGVVSLGCIGNRVYTDLGEDEFYLVIPGKRLMEVAEQAPVIATANDTLEQYHKQRRQSLGTPQL